MNDVTKARQDQPEAVERLLQDLHLELCRGDFTYKLRHGTEMPEPRESVRRNALLLLSSIPGVAFPEEQRRFVRWFLAMSWLNETAVSLNCLLNERTLRAYKAERRRKRLGNKILRDAHKKHVSSIRAHAERLRAMGRTKPE